MRVAVIGGTIGREIVVHLERGAHDVRVVSRNAPQHRADLTTGTGLQAALEGCEVVVDASNGPASSRARGVLGDGCQRLLRAEQQLGVRHHVCVSIVGIDHVPGGSYKVKLAQEATVQRGEVAWSIVRSTQLHDLLAGMLSAAGRLHVLPAAQAKFQPVDAAEVAATVAAVAIGAPRLGPTTIAGPKILDFRSLGQTWRQVTGRHAIQIPVFLPGRLGRALRDGKLTCSDPDVRGNRTSPTGLKHTLANRDRFVHRPAPAMAPSTAQRAPPAFHRHGRAARLSHHEGF